MEVGERDLQHLCFTSHDTAKFLAVEEQQKEPDVGAVDRLPILDERSLCTSGAGAAVAAIWPVWWFIGDCPTFGSYWRHLFQTDFHDTFPSSTFLNVHFSHSWIFQMRLLWCSTNSSPASPPRNPMFSKLQFFCLNCWGIFSFGTNPKWESWLHDLPLVLAGCTSGRDGYRVTNSASWDLAGTLVEKSLVIDQAWRTPQTLSQPGIKKEQHAQTIMINHEVWDSPFQGFKVVHYIHVFIESGNIVGRSIELP